MTEDRAAASAAHRVGSGAGRLVRAWRNLPHERRLAAYGAIGLFLTLFLPWYQETVIATSKATSLQSASATLTGWGAFSFVEAAVLLVAAGVLTLLFQRAEGRAFHLPGGDGWVISAAGAWTCVLVIWRIFDKQGTSSHAQFATTSGIEWGIFVALAVAAFLAYAGARIRAAHQPEPPLPGEELSPEADWSAPQVPSRPGPPTPGPSPEPASERTRPRPPRTERPIGWLSARSQDEPVSIEDPPTFPAVPRPVPADARSEPADRRPSQAVPPSTAPTRRQQQPDEQLTIPVDDKDVEER